MKLNILKSDDVRHSPEWGDYMESIGFKVIRLHDQNIFIRRIKFINRSIIKIQHTHGPLDLKEIDRIAKEEKSFIVIIEPHSWGYSNQELIEHGYKLSKMQLAPSSTIKIDLTLTREELFSSFSENAKRNIKRAKSKNIKVKLINMKKEKNMDAFEDFFKLQKNLTKLKKFYAPGYKESLKKMSALKNSSVLAFAYDEENIPIAVVWFATYKKTIAYIQTGITKKGYEYLANYLLVWEGLIWAKKNKLEVFDFESIYDSRYPNQNKRWIGYTSFKKRFHGEVISYPPSWIKYYSYIFKVFIYIATFFDKPAKEIVNSDINGQIIIGKSFGKKAIFVNGIPQSGGELSSMWNKIIKSYKDKDKKVKKCLVLGVGGGDIIREIQSDFPKTEIIAVELDPIMLEIANEQFGTTNKNTKFILSDAIDYIENLKSEKFDLIFVDLFIGRLNPQEAREEKFIKDLSKLLTQSGSIFYNSHYQNRKSSDFKIFNKLCTTIFNNVEIIFSYPRNKVILLNN